MGVSAGTGLPGREKTGPKTAMNIAERLLEVL